MYKNINTLFLIILILVFAVFLRFNGIMQKGIFFSDEGGYLQSAQFYVSALEVAKTTLLQHSDTGYPDGVTLKGSLNNGRSPFNSTLLSISMLVFGEHDWVGNVVSAVFGLLTIFIVFHLAKIMYNQKVALLSAALLAVSGYHILYSRETLAEINATFFFILGVYIYYKYCHFNIKKHFYLFITGFIGALAIGVHARMLLFIPLIILFEVVFFIKVKPVSFKKIGIRFGYLFLGVFSGLFLFQLPYYAGKMVAMKMGKELLIRTYFIQLYDQYLGSILSTKTSLISGISESAESLGAVLETFSKLLTYPYLIWSYESFIITILFGCSVLYLFYRTYRSRKFEDISLLIYIMFLYLFWSFYPLGAFSRYFVVVIPVLAIIGGLAIHSFMEICMRKFKMNENYFMFSIISVLLLVGSINAAGIIKIKSGFRQAVDYLVENNNDACIATNSRLFDFYLPKTRSFLWKTQNPLQDLMERYNSGAQLLVVSSQKYVMKPPFYKDEKKRLLEEIENKCVPIKRIPNNSDRKSVV